MLARQSENKPGVNPIATSSRESCPAGTPEVDRVYKPDQSLYESSSTSSFAAQLPCVYVQLPSLRSTLCSLSRKSEVMATMRATLMLLLLLGAVVAAHGRKISVENKLVKPIRVNGITISTRMVVDIDVQGVVGSAVLEIAVPDLWGKQCLIRINSCPNEVTAIVVVCELGYVRVIVKSAIIVQYIGIKLGLSQCKC